MKQVVKIEALGEHSVDLWNSRWAMYFTTLSASLGGDITENSPVLFVVEFSSMEDADKFARASKDTLYALDISAHVALTVCS